MSASSLATSQSRDEKLVLEAKLPFTYDEIVNSSIEQFNDKVAKLNLDEIQLSLVRDVRRRGKNKVAAQTCRRRKIDQIMRLQNEVHDLLEQKSSLQEEHCRLIEDLNYLTSVYNLINKTLVECHNLRVTNDATG